MLRNLIQVVHVADVSEQNIITALNSDWKDFEDSVQNAVAESHQYDVIITRNKSDYKKSSIKVLSPDEFLIEIKDS